MSKLQSDVTNKFQENADADDDAEDSGDDNYDDFLDSIPTSPNCENDFEHIDSLSKRFKQCNDTCVFFMGSLRDACQAAFSSTLIQERRPILLYIHNDEDLFRQKFCETNFYSTAIAVYLNTNYVVWPWKVTLELDRDTLTKIWEEMFSTRFFDKFSIEQCPLLIGIMRSFEYRTKEGIISEYQFKSLVKENILTRTQTTVNSDILLNELNIFKDKCDKNELGLSFDFAKKTGLCWDIILEIAEYLSLNDAISAFSINILCRLNHPQAKFQLSNPCDPFIQMILPKIKSEQIRSLQLDMTRSYSENELIFLSNFTEVTSIAFHHPPYYYRLGQYISRFSSLTRLSLYYDSNVDYFTLTAILDQLQQPIKHFELHCPELFCTDYHTYKSNQRHGKTTSIEYLLLDVGYYSWTSNKKFLRHLNPCYFLTRPDFTQMPNIRRIHFIIKKYDIEHFNDDSQWRTLVNICSQLKRITLQVLRNTSEDEQILKKKVLDIQTILTTKRETIKLQISFL